MPSRRKSASGRRRGITRYHEASACKALAPGSRSGAKSMRCVMASKPLFLGTRIGRANRFATINPCCSFRVCSAPANLVIPIKEWN